MAWISVILRPNPRTGLRFMNINTNTHRSPSTRQVQGLRRVLLVVQFKDMCPWKGISDDDDMRPELVAEARVLDVPESVLDSSFNIYLEPALASVFLLSDESIMHKFRFA